MSETENLQELANLTVDEITDRIPSLSPEQLAELRVLESATDKPRKGVLEAIDAALPEDAPPPAKTAKAEKAKPEPWKAPDYDGPLDIVQAAWRNHNLKPAAAVVRPVVGVRTK